MDSTVMKNNYATSGATQLGMQIVTLLSEKVTYDNNIGQFAFPSITPNTSMSEAYDRSMPKTGTGNVINKDNLGITNITNSNYIELMNIASQAPVYESKVEHLTKKLSQFLK